MFAWNPVEFRSYIGPIESSSKSVSEEGLRMISKLIKISAEIIPRATYEVTSRKHQPAKLTTIWQIWPTEPDFLEIGRSPVEDKAIKELLVFDTEKPFPSFLARYIGTHVAIVIVHSRLTPLYDALPRGCSIRIRISTLRRGAIAARLNTAGVAEAGCRWLRWRSRDRRSVSVTKVWLF